MSVDPSKMLHGMLMGDEPGYLEFRFRAEGEWQGPHFVNLAQRSACLRLMRMEHSSVGAIPRRRPERRAPLTGASVLWCRPQSAKHAEALARFQPGPTLVLREGKSPRRTALWALATPIAPDWAERANRRIAHAIGCPKKFGDAEQDFYPPGTTLVLGSKPVQVWAEHMDPGALYQARGVVGHLRDAPAAFDWRKEKEAA